jgi:hypothetical protein
MISTHRRLSLSARAASFLNAFVILGVFAATSLWAPAAHAQERTADQNQVEIVAPAPTSEATTTAAPFLQMQYASIVATGNTLTISRVPENFAGVIMYKDFTVQFALDSGGKMTIAPGYPTVVLSPSLLVAGFKAGTYVGPINNDYPPISPGIALAGPGIGSGASVWSIAAAPPYDPCTAPGNATFWVGSLAGNPIAARLTKAGITNTSMSYGVSGAQLCYPSRSDQGPWMANSILGFSQVGSTVTITSFSLYGGNTNTSGNDGQGGDKNVPTGELTFTLK